MDIVQQLRLHAEDLHSVQGHNTPAVAMSQAADEIERLRQRISELDGQVGKRPCRNDRYLNHNQLEKANADLRTAVKYAAEVFRRYEAHHMAKPDPEKAKQNLEHAHVMYRALGWDTDKGEA